MIRPPGVRGGAFGSAADGNGRDDPGARRRISAALGIPEGWAILRQVHGAEVVWASRAGHLGDGDAAVTDRPMLPLSVATADCFPVILETEGAVGIAHAGWRGAAEGVVAALRSALELAGAPVLRAAVGPGIGPCCFEVSPDVVARFPGSSASTRWGTRSVDLPAVIRAQLVGVKDVWEAGVCTRCDEAYHSHRRDGTRDRQVAVAWLSST